jgi:hypothetical protein
MRILIAVGSPKKLVVVATSAPVSKKDPKSIEDTIRAIQLATIVLGVSTNDRLFMKAHHRPDILDAEVGFLVRLTTAGRDIFQKDREEIL